MQRILILSHVPPLFSGAGQEVLGWGDAVRLLEAVRSLSSDHVAVHLCVRQPVKDFLHHPQITGRLTAEIISWEELRAHDLASFGRIVFVDNPSLWPALREHYDLPPAVLLWQGSRDFKKVSTHFYSELLNCLGVASATVPRQLHSTPFPSQQKRIALNPHVPPAWANKTPAPEFWAGLASALEEEGFSVSWPRGADNLAEYVEWLAGQDIVVSPNSFGFHLALLMGKGIVFLQGPTWCEEVDWLPGELVIKPECGFSPCFEKKCPVNQECFAGVRAEDVIMRVKAWLN